MRATGIKTIILVMLLFVSLLASMLNAKHVSVETSTDIATPNEAEKLVNATDTKVTTTQQTVTITITVANTTITKTTTESTTVTYVLYHTIPSLSVVTVHIGLGVEQAISIITVLALVTICIGYFVGFRFARERCVEEVAKKAKEVKRR